MNPTATHHTAVDHLWWCHGQPDEAAAGGANWVDAANTPSLTAGGADDTIGWRVLQGRCGNAAAAKNTGGMAATLPPMCTAPWQPPRLSVVATTNYEFGSAHPLGHCPNP